MFITHHVIGWILYAFWLIIAFDLPEDNRREGGGGRGKRFVFWILTSLNPKILIFLVLCYNNEEQMYSNIKLGSLVLS